jgi:hypothetical protein
MASDVRGRRVTVGIAFLRNVPPDLRTTGTLRGRATHGREDTVLSRVRPVVHATRDRDGAAPETLVR